MYNFQKLPKLVNLRGKTKHNGWYKVYDPSVKTDIAIHHSLTKTGNSAAFANYHVGTLGWPEVAYHFVILKDGTIEWNHDLGVLSYHVGNSNKFSVGICVVGDFRTEEPTKEQEESLYLLHEALKKDLPNYKRTRGHNEFPGYAWKACPEFDYRAVVSREPKVACVPAQPLPNQYTVQQGDTFYSIAKELAGVTMDDLLKANPNVNPKALRIGQAINMPKAKAVAVAKPALKPSTLIVLVGALHTYKTANWNDKSGPIVNKNEVFTIKRELTVKGSKMYELKSGLYITANPKYVKVRKG